MMVVVISDEVSQFRFYVPSFQKKTAASIITLGGNCALRVYNIFFLSRLGQQRQFSSLFPLLTYVPMNCAEILLG
jgi:hypothetical protein